MPGKPFLSEPFLTVLSKSITNHHRNAIPRRYAHAQMNVIQHRFSFHQFNTLLPTQIPQYRSNAIPYFSVKDFVTVLWYENYIH
jgi:hypothetical protein